MRMLKRTRALRRIAKEMKKANELSALAIQNAALGHQTANETMKRLGGVHTALVEINNNLAEFVDHAKKAPEAVDDAIGNIVNTVRQIVGEANPRLVETHADPIAHGPFPQSNKTEGEVSYLEDATLPPGDGETESEANEE